MCQIIWPCLKKKTNKQKCFYFFCSLTNLITGSSFSICNLTKLYKGGLNGWLHQQFYRQSLKGNSILSISSMYFIINILKMIFHQSIFYIWYNAASRGAGAYANGQNVGTALNRLPVCDRNTLRWTVMHTHIHTQGQLEPPINPSYVCFWTVGGNRSTVLNVNSHPHMGKTCILSQFSTT